LAKPDHGNKIENSGSACDPPISKNEGRLYDLGDKRDKVENGINKEHLFASTQEIISLKSKMRRL